MLKAPHSPRLMLHQRKKLLESVILNAAKESLWQQLHEQYCSILVSANVATFGYPCLDQNASFSLFLADIFEERTEINVTTPFPDSLLNSCVLRIALCPFPFLFLSFGF